MSDRLHVVSAAITPLPPPTDDEGQPLETIVGPPSDMLDVAIDIRNASDATQHIWSTASRISYDKATRTLTLDLADPGSVATPEFEPISVHPRIPALTAIGAGETGTVHVSVPRVTHRTHIVMHDDTPQIAIDPEPVGAVERVDARIAFADEPLQPSGDLTLDSLRGQISDWGQVVDTSFAVTWKPEASGKRADGR